MGAPVGFVVLFCPNAPGYVAQLPDLFERPLPTRSLIIRGEKETYAAGIPDFEEKQKKGTFTLDTCGEDAPAAHVARLFEAEKCTVLAHKEDHRPWPANKQDSDEM